MEILLNLFLTAVLIFAGWLNLKIEKHEEEFEEATSSRFKIKAKQLIKRSKQLAFLVLVICACITLSISITQITQGDILEKRIDSLNYQNDSLKGQIAIVDGGVSTANSKLNGIAKNDLIILQSQLMTFSKTAANIKQSADTLLKYINGDEGFASVDAKLMSNGSAFLNITNPNKYALKNVRIHGYRYQDFIAAVTLVDGKSIINYDKLSKKLYFFAERQVLSGSELIPTARLSTSGIEESFYIEIWVGSRSYAEELVCNIGLRKSAYIIYDRQKPPFRVVAKKSVEDIKIWRDLFKVNLQQMFYMNL